MPKRRIPEEAQEAGRMIGTMERVGYKELVEEVRAMAKAEGKTLTDKLAEVIRAGLDYTRYEKLTLADAMRVMDFIERAFNNFLYPVMYTSRSMIDQAELERIKTFAQYMGMIPRDLAEEYIKQREEELKQELEQQQQQQQPQATGPITTFVTKMAERLAETLSEEVIKRLIAEGKLEDFLEMVSNVAKNAVVQTLAESAMEKGGQG